MTKIIIVVLSSFIVSCICFEAEQRSTSEGESVRTSESDEDTFELESRQDFDKTSEKEREFKILRKTNILKDDNYRRALESILPSKNSDSYRKFFEGLINNPDGESKNEEPEKELEEVVVADQFLDRAVADDNNDDEPQVEEIEVVIEQISDPDNGTKTAPESRSANPEDKTEPQKEKSKPVNVQVPNKKQPKTNSTRPNLAADERSGIGHGASIERLDGLQMARFEDRRVMEPYPVSRISEVVIPHYRTTLTRSGLVVSPAVYTVQSSAPIIDHVTNRNWIASRPLAPEYFARTGGHKYPRESDARLIDDYNDYDSNSYSYAPSRTQGSRQAVSKVDALSKLAEGSYQPLGAVQPYRENLYPPAYYPPGQRYFSDGYRPMFRYQR